MSNNEIKETVRKAKEEIKNIIIHGLDKVYVNFEDYMFDFYPNFSWDDNTEELMLLIKDEEFINYCKTIKEVYNFDLLEDLNKSIKETRQYKRNTFNESKKLSNITFQGKLITTVVKTVGSSGQISVGARHAGKKIIAYVFLNPD